MPKKPIGDFASVGEAKAKAYCQSLLQRGCELLTPLTDEEHRRVSLLMKHHPDYTQGLAVMPSYSVKRAILFTLRLYGTGFRMDGVPWPLKFGDSGLAFDRLHTGTFVAAAAVRTATHTVGLHRIAGR